MAEVLTEPVEDGATKLVTVDWAPAEGVVVKYVIDCTVEVLADEDGVDEVLDTEDEELKLEALDVVVVEVVL